MSSDYLTPYILIPDQLRNLLYVCCTSSELTVVKLIQELTMMEAQERMLTFVTFSISSLHFLMCTGALTTCMSV